MTPCSADDLRDVIARATLRVERALTGDIGISGTGVQDALAALEEAAQTIESCRLVPFEVSDAEKKGLLSLVGYLRSLILHVMLKQLHRWSMEPRAHRADPHSLN